MRRSWNDASKLVRLILGLQATIIVGLSIWIYKEYVSNSYLQAYLANLFRGTGSIIAVMSLGGLVATVLVGILLKAGNILGDIEHLSKNVDHDTGLAQAGSETATTIPVLKVVDAQPIDEIGRLHTSLQKWNERSKSRE
jgi:ABC-type xylose transport system permease subunit